MTLEEQIKIVKREIGFRKRLYPVWVEKGKITQIEADYQIDGMECVLNSLLVLHKFHIDLISKNEKMVQEELL